jgi:hypothetical protein
VSLYLAGAVRIKVYGIYILSPGNVIYTYRKREMGESPQLMGRLKVHCRINPEIIGYPVAVPV